MGAFEAFEAAKLAHSKDAMQCWHDELHAMRAKQGGAEFRELRLQSWVANHGGADALVYVPRDFDSSKPVNLVVYNHGFGSTAGGALERTRIREMMSNAQPNTVLVVPEWQAHPGTRNGNMGRFADANHFSRMLQEVMQKTPALHDLGVRDIARIDIIAHSAGYAATEAEIYNNKELSGKVGSITLLDSLYDRHGFDKWLRENFDDLSAGRKQFFNVFNSSTAENSRAQESMVASMAHHKHLPRSIVFMQTATKHLDIPAAYIGRTLAALNSQAVSNVRSDRA